MQKYMHNHENPLIMKIMVLTIILTMAAHAQITTLATLQTAITNAADGETITITNNITVGELITIPDGTNITLTGGQLTRGTTGNLITVASGGSLILENIIIDGGKNGSYSTGGGGRLVTVNGMLTMKNGAVLQNNINSYVMGAYGGGVYVNGTFTMNGGTISGNTSAITGTFPTYGGGGVYVNSGTFTMNSGIITDNTLDASSSSNTNLNAHGGGIYVSGGTFSMNGGEISGNEAIAKGTGNAVGGAFINDGVTFTVGGAAKITSNTATSPSGEKINNVYLYYRYITLDNPAPGMSIGVYTFTASGVIVENGATAEDAKYFFTDEADKTVAYDNGTLKLVPANTITYNANNGTGETSSDKVAEGSDYTVKPNAFTQTGYTFTVWNTEPDGNGIDHEEGEEFSNVTADITLYAQWVEVTSSSSSEATPSSSSEEPSSSSSEETSSSSSGDGTPIRLPQIAGAPISVHATSNAIILQNLPTNAKVEVYNLQGKRVYMNNPVNPLIMKIKVQTKGIYIVKVMGVSHTPNIYRVMVK
jgi:hypothetical protein